VITTVGNGLADELIVLGSLVESVLYGQYNQIRKLTVLTLQVHSFSLKLYSGNQLPEFKMGKGWMLTLVFTTLWLGTLQLARISIVGVVTILSHYFHVGQKDRADLHRRNISFLACCNLTRQPGFQRRVKASVMTHVGYHQCTDTWVRRYDKWNRNQTWHYPGHHIRTCRNCCHTQDRGNKNNHRSFDLYPFGSDPCFHHSWLQG
jgi:hypothetical protein